MCTRIINALNRDERGIAALEYVILALVVVAAIAAGGVVLKSTIFSAFDSLGSTVSSTIASQ